MAKKKTAPKQDPFAGFEGQGMDVAISSGGAQSFYYLNYNNGEISTKGDKVPGFFYIALDEEDEQDHEWELPEPWERGRIPLGGEMKDVWMASILPDITWIAYIEYRQITWQGMNYKFGPRTANLDMYLPDGTFLGDASKDKKKHFVAVHEDFDDLPKSVIFTMNGRARELMLANNPADSQWGHADMGVGIINELYQYTIEINTDKGTSFKPLGMWKMTLVPMEDDDGEPIFFSIPTQSGEYYFNPFEMQIDEDPTKAVVSQERRMLINDMYDVWVRDWVKAIPRKGLVERKGAQQDDDMNQDAGFTPGSTGAVEEDIIPF